MRTLEAFSDANLGPNEQESTTGPVICYQGCPLMWLTARQTFALSTAEAELMALLEAMGGVEIYGILDQ